MSNRITTTINQFNGTDYDILLPTSSYNFGYWDGTGTYGKSNPVTIAFQNRINTIRFFEFTKRQEYYGLVGESFLSNFGDSVYFNKKAFSFTSTNSFEVYSFNISCSKDGKTIKIYSDVDAKNQLNRQGYSYWAVGYWVQS